ncbi:MAG: ADP-forming succinate--CoA ligase subunit beta [Pseudomonadota bacterium]
MNLLEFQAKELLARAGIATPRGRVAGSADDAERVACRLGLSRFLVKAQVPAGGRAAADGIRFANTPTEVKQTAAALLGKRLVTAQTGAAGKLVQWVYVEEVVLDARHLYAAVLLDRSAGSLMLLLSGEGGEDIETRAEANPDLVTRIDVSRLDAAKRDEIEAAARRTGLDAATAASFAALAEDLVEAAFALDATLIEINPLALTADGRLIALDAKITIDDNALFRHADLAALRSASVIEDGDPQEVEAQRHQLNYMRLDGDIGVVVNGAGLALATIDLLSAAGGAPANFMDIRTTASTLDVAYGFELILSNPRTRAVLVNVHGGGMQKCDTIAEGIGIAMRRAARPVPIVVRFAGNNAQFALTRLKSYGVPFVEAEDMRDAADQAAAAAKGGGR